MPDTPPCGLPHYTWPETLCTEPAGHYRPDTDPHAGPLTINGRHCGGAAWDEPTEPTSCQTVTTTAGPARITGDRPLTDIELGYAAQIIAAARRRHAGEHPKGADVTERPTVPCHRAIPHPAHVHLRNRQPLRCPGVGTTPGTSGRTETGPTIPNPQANTPAPVDPALQQRVARAIWERQNPGRSYADCEPPWNADAEADAEVVLAELAPELDALADYRNRIIWETTCGEHAALLDACRAADERAEQAEVILRDLVGLTAVTHAHRIQGGHDTLGPNHTCAGCALAERARRHLTGQPATTGTAVQCSACGGLNGQHWHRCPDRGTPAPAGLRDAIAHELHAAGGPFANTDAETLADAVLAAIQPVLDDLAHARAELADWYARDSADAAAGSYAGRAEQAEWRIAQALAVAEVIEANGIGWAADSIRAALTGQPSITPNGH